jgi:hypothetical protein
MQAMHPEQLQQLQELAERHPRYLMTYSKQPPSAKAATGQLQAPAAAAAGSPDGGRRGLIHRVLLHERNGLQHGGFIVPTAACGQVCPLLPAVGLRWNLSVQARRRTNPVRQSLLAPEPAGIALTMSSLLDAGARPVMEQ